MACAATAASVALAGCSGTPEDAGSDPQSPWQSSQSARPLEVPPDLTSVPDRDTLQVPGVGATYSQYASEEESEGARAGTPAPAAVLPELNSLRIERSADQRWLVLAMEPEEAWPEVRNFWLGQGFGIETEEPEVGVMETDWREERSALPAGFLKQMTSLISETFHGVAVRDRYRTRIERGVEPDTIDIYISHRRAEQMAVGDESPLAQRDGAIERVWQPRPNDPGLEAEMLYRLMLFLGADERRAKALVAEAAPPEPRVRFVREEDGGTALVIGEDFSGGWRRTGIALDRAGLTVEDRDRSRGLFFVRYTDPEAGGAEEEAGWLSRLTFWKGDEGEEPLQGDDAYIIRVIGETGAETRVVVLDREGQRDESPTAHRILALLQEQVE